MACDHWPRARAREIMQGSSIDVHRQCLCTWQQGWRRQHVPQQGSLLPQKQILGGKSANLSQIGVSRRTQWRGLPQHLAGTVRPLALVRVVVSATSQPCHPAAKTNATKLIGLRSNGSRSKARSNVIARRLWRCEDPHPIHLARVHHRSSTGWAPTSLAGARCEAFRL